MIGISIPLRLRFPTLYCPRCVTRNIVRALVLLYIGLVRIRLIGRVNRNRLMLCLTRNVKFLTVIVRIVIRGVLCGRW